MPAVKRIKPPKITPCPTCSKPMEQYGQVYTCRGCGVSHYGPYLEGRKR